jgi:hypothetical protein
VSYVVRSDFLSIVSKESKNMGRKLVLAVFIIALVSGFFSNYNSPNNVALAATPVPPRKLMTSTICRQMHEDGTDINPPFCYAAVGLLELMTIVSTAE